MFLITILRSIFVITLSLSLFIISGLTIGHQHVYPSVVYIAKSDPHDEVRLLDLNTGFWIEIARNDSFGVVDVSNEGDILVTTHAQVGSILNTISPKLADTVHGIDDNPTWSPSAERIAYRRYYYQGSLYIYTREQWPPRPLDIRATAITWSPDGRLLAYSRWNTTSNQEEIRTIDIRSREDGLVAGWRRPVRYMRWSPDGTQIALTTIAGEFYVLDVASRQFEQRLADVQNVRSVQWSPDGHFLGAISVERGMSKLTILHKDSDTPIDFKLDDLSRTSSFDWWSTQ